MEFDVNNDGRLQNAGFYLLSITDDEGNTTSHVLDGGEIRLLIQTLDNAIL